MRIALFTDIYKPAGNGVVTSVESFALELRLQGHEVTIVCPSYPGFTETDDAILRLGAVASPTIKDKDARMALLSAKIERHMKNNVYDVIHIFSPFSIGVAGIFYAKRFGLPIVYTAHTNYADYRRYIPGGNLIPSAVIDKLASRFSNNIDLTIAPSQKVADSLVRNGAKKAIAILPTGVAKMPAGHRAEFKARYGLGQVVNFLYVGSIIEGKNLELLVYSFYQALDRLSPKSQLVLVGDGPYRDELQDLVDELELSDRVVFTGFLSGQDRADAYAAADIFCHASHSETQGMTLLEAGYYGLPLVVCDDSAYKGIAVNGKNALLASDTSRSYANQMVKLASDRLLRQKLSDGSRAVAAKYSITDQTEQLVALYEETIGIKRMSVHEQVGVK